MELNQKHVVVVGDGGCGKTSLLLMFSKYQFRQDSSPTSCETSRGTIVIDGTQVEFTFLDTGGDDNYDRVRRFFYSTVDAILLCFSMDSPNTLVEISDRWMPQLREHCPNIPIVLVGNKKELQNAECTIDTLAKMNKVPLKTEDGLAVARMINAYAYLECSAKLNEGVREVFEALSRACSGTKTKNKKCTVQ